jgi:hypothetical protein
MIPHVISVKTDLKQRHFLTFKKELAIGMEANSDLIINHPFFKKGSQVLTVGVSGVKGKKSDDGEICSKRSQRSMEISGLRIRCRSLKIPVVLLLLLFLTSILFGHVMNKTSAGHGNQNWGEIPLPAKEAYGFCRMDRNHPEGIVYVFKVEDPTLHLISFTPGGNGDGSTFSLSVNRSLLLDSAILPEGWDINRIVRVPADLIRPGINNIEFRYNPHTQDSKYWGVKAVAAVRVRERNIDKDKIEEMLKSSEKMLSGQTVSGPDLGRLYVHLNALAIPEHLPEMVLRKRNLFDALQIRMTETAQNTLFHIKSARIIGDENRAAELSGQVRAWIPEEWAEGRRMIDVYRQ